MSVQHRRGPTGRWERVMKRYSAIETARAIAEAESEAAKTYRDHWVGVEQARREALEDAAKVADAHRNRDAEFPDYDGGYDSAAEDIAAAIRALKEKE